MTHETRRIDPLLALGVATAVGPPLLLSPWVTGAVLMLAVVLTHRACPRWLPWAGALLAIVAAVRTHRALRVADEGHQRTVVALTPPRRCEFEGEVVRSPVVITAAGSLQEPAGSAELGRARIDVRVLTGTCEQGPAPNTIVRLHGGPETAVRGATLEIVADMAAVQRFDNPGSLEPALGLALSGVTASGRFIDARTVERGRGLRAAIDRARARVRRRIEASFSRDVAPLARALVLGETDLIEGDREAFRDSGLAHLLAVSGTHLVLAVLAFVRLLTFLLLRINVLARRLDVRRIAAALGLPLALIYADFAGGGGSAWRAAVMLAAALLTRVFARRASPSRCLAFALAGPALMDPLVLADASFALSLAATSALMLTAEHRDSGATAPRLGRLRAMMRVTLAATLGTAPVLLLLGARLPLHGVAANLLAAPVGELVALPASLLHAGAWWAPPVESRLAALAGGGLRLVRAIAFSASTGPLATIRLPPPTALELGILAVGTLAMFRTRPLRLWILALTMTALGGAEWIASVQGKPKDGLRITALDVGQGDSLLVDFPDGRAMLIDGGGMVGSGIDIGKRVLLPELAARRRRRLDVVVITHPHPDHFLGLLSALPELEVGELWESGLASATQPDGPLARLIEMLIKRGTIRRGPAELCPLSRAFGGVDVAVLAPCPAFDSSASANDNSIVLRLRYGARTALLVGDAERATETQLIEHEGRGLRADLLKVGHHGSRTSSTAEFLDAVRPELAMISSGVRNRFGHPAPITLDTLRARDVDVWRTDREGAIAFWTDGKTMRVTTAREARQALRRVSR